MWIYSLLEIGEITFKKTYTFNFDNSEIYWTNLYIVLHLEYNSRGGSFTAVLLQNAMLH